jgi:YibE/F-like protein
VARGIFLPTSVWPCPSIKSARPPRAATSREDGAPLLGSFRFRELFGRALEVGRDHVSATVNTLVLTYVGAAPLPILLLFSATDVGAADAVNFEIVAKEIVATLVG